MFYPGEKKSAGEAGDRAPEKDLVHERAREDAGQLPAGEFGKEGIVSCDKSQYHETSEGRYGEAKV